MSTVQSEPYSERVCVIIADATISEDQLRRALGDALPLRVVHWQDAGYLTVVRNLRPRVIVIASTNVETAEDSTALIAVLFARFAPTVIGLTLAPSEREQARLMVVALGVHTAARIAALDDLRLS